MSLPYLKEFGWAATVLAVEPAGIEGATMDPLLESTLPRDVPIYRFGSVRSAVTRMLGLGNLAMRSLPYLWRAGNRLLSGQLRAPSWKLQAPPFDLVYFSTTQFPVMILGFVWKKKFNVPYVVDFQDPWLDDYYERTATEPPGGKLRYRASRFLASRLEPRVMRDVAEIISVSPSYVDTLHDRYPHLRTDQFTVLPFGAPEKDFEMLQSLDVQQHVFDPADGKQHWIYAGAVGKIMETALQLLFGAIQERRIREPNAWRDVRLHFIGTSYAPGGRAKKTVEPIAAACGVADIVQEQTSRRPYFEMLRALTEADALLVIGSDSPSYSASKLYPYILAKRPMLSILHRDSPAVDILRRCRAGEIVTFDPARLDESRSAMSEALKMLKEKVESRKAKVIEGEDQTDVDWDEFQQYTAREMTRRQCEVFDRAVGGKVESRK
ncbi:MAG: hypothetical protein H0U43_08745 [Chthoniobacterales bacterium]|nr:hypothetical protein [Chthoniobacterales bacterium]